MQHRLKSSFLLTLLLALTVILAACGQSSDKEAASPSESESTTGTTADAGQEISVQDATGATLTLPKAPERIVAMDFSFTDMLVSLGVQPVGVADDDDAGLFMDTVKSKLGEYKSVGSRYEPNIELISSLQPDLIIADIEKHKAAIEQLKGIAPVLVLNDFQADYNQMLKNFEIVAKVVNKEAEGTTRLAEHQAKMDEAKAAIKDASLTVLPAVVNPTGFFGHSDHSYSGSVLKFLGFTDPVSNEKAYPQLTLEQLVETNPQALFLMPTEEVTIVNEWEKNELWKKLDAVTNNRVYTVERRNWSLSRGPLGSEKIAEDIVAQLGAK